MTYLSPFPAPITTGSDAKMKALRAEGKKRMPPPTTGVNHPTKYGTTIKQDKMRQALELLGAGQSFPNQPPTSGV
jgi:hypothetical protein